MNNKKLCLFYFIYNNYTSTVTLPNVIAVDFSVVISKELWRQAVISNAASYELAQQLKHHIVPPHNIHKKSTPKFD